MVWKISVAAAMLAATLVASPVPPPAELPPSSDGAAVKINGVTITIREIETNRPAAMFQARSNYYEAARKTIDEYVDDYLLREQARKENLTVPQLLEKHVNSVIVKDSFEEILRVYYETADTTEPYPPIREKILDAIRQKRISKAKAAYMLSLRNQAQIAIVLPAPRAPMEDAISRGPANAPVVLTEFADYECPYCQQVQPTLQALEAEFKGKMAFQYKDFPLPSHPNAQKAAEATRCAQAQGKYWEFHDVLTTTKTLDVSVLKDVARYLKLDETAFAKCLDNGEKADVVKATATEAQALGIQGTPTFFINGRYISGALSLEHLRAAILEELGAKEQRPAASGPDAPRRN